jgi:hypothetical protein
MKKLFTIIIVLFISQLTFGQDITLATWTFPTGNLMDTIVEEASDLNLNVYINTMGGTSAISMKNGASTKAAQAEGWNAGVDTKAWRIFLNTTGYENLKLSSKQQSGNTNPGPRDWQLQVKIGDAGNWQNVTNGAYTAANDWTTSALDALPLPAECNNQPLIYVRWVMTSNFDIYGGEVLSTGTSKIDDILLTGTVITGIGENENQQLVKVYPNPASDKITIESAENIGQIEIINATGAVVVSAQPNQNIYTYQGKLAAGVYMVRVVPVANLRPATTKLVVW